MNNCPTILALVTAILVSATPHISQAGEAHLHLHTVKPGAAVGLSHNYDGQTPVGEEETFTISLTLSSQAIHEVHISLSDNHSGFRLTSEREQRISPATTTILVPVVLQTLLEGEHHLGVFVTTKNKAGGAMSRAFEIPIHVGDGLTSSAKSDSESETKANYKGSPRGMVIMPAREKIHYE